MAGTKSIKNDFLAITLHLPAIDIQNPCKKIPFQKPS